MPKTFAEYGEDHLSELIPRPDKEVTKPQMYKSKFRHAVADENKFEKFNNKTMGPAKVKVRTPENFLKKSDGSTAQIPIPPNSMNKYNCDSGFMAHGDSQSLPPRKPDIPKRQNKVPAPTKKDFIKANAVENMTSVPRKAKQNYVDTNMGHANDLITSGLIPRYTNKKDFGHVPEYLNKRNTIVKQAQDDYDQFVFDKMRQNSLQCISNDDRDAVLCGLKARWEKIHHEYQGISVVTDTAPKKNRKERMEAQMSQLERDIDLLERFGHIYVARN